MEMSNVAPFMFWGDECPEWVQGKESTVQKSTKTFVLIKKAFLLFEANVGPSG